MKILYFTFLLLIISNTITAQSEEALIRNSLQKYIDGSSYNDPELIKEAFYTDANLFLSKKDQEIWVLSVQEYCALFENREKGEFNGRTGKIITIDQENNIALAKVEISIPAYNTRYIDIFLLKKLEGTWKIISKAATKMPE